MRRIAIGVTTALAIWFGSAVVAEAQPTITSTGPLSVVAGSTTSTYTANIYLPAPSSYVVRLWVYNGANQIHYSQTIVPNPGVSNSVFSKVASHGAPPSTGNVLTYKAKMKVGTIWYDAADWTVTVTGTRPTKPGSYQKSSSLALQSVDRDRRRE